MDDAGALDAAADAMRRRRGVVRAGGAPFMNLRRVLSSGRLRPHRSASASALTAAAGGRREKPRRIAPALAIGRRSRRGSHRSSRAPPQRVVGWGVHNNRAVGCRERKAASPALGGARGTRRNGSTLHRRETRGEATRGLRPRARTGSGAIRRWWGIAGDTTGAARTSLKTRERRLSIYYSLQRTGRCTSTAVQSNSMASRLEGGDPEAPGWVDRSMGHLSANVVRVLVHSLTVQ